MNFKKTLIPDVLIIEPSLHGDDRGYFTETFRADKLEEYLGHKIDFCQDSESKSFYGVLRGLHYQIAPYAQTKLVRVIHGRVLDIAVDIREGSPTFGKHVAVELSGENKKQLLIPRGFAHGFIVLSQNCLFTYKVDNYYSASSERGIAFDDKALSIEWQIPHEKLILSAKDKVQPTLQQATELFKYDVCYYNSECENAKE